MKKSITYLIIAAVAIVFIGTLVMLYMKSMKKPIVFKSEKPFYTTIIDKTVATGSIVPRKEIDIKPHVQGIIQEIYVEAGEIVKSGDLIAKIQVIPDMLSLNSAESRLTKAKLAFEDTRLEFNRQKKLYEKNVIAEAEYLKAKLTYQNAFEEVDAAENNLQIIKEGVSKKAGTSTNTLVRSTIDGMVLDVPVEIGNSVIASNNFNEGTTIASVANMGAMVFEGKVDETEVGRIKEGMPIELTVGAIDDTKFDATLEYISPKGIEENGAIQFEIKAAVILKDSVFIRAGYSANADIVLAQKDSVLAIKESMLQFNKEGDSTFVDIQLGEIDTTKKKSTKEIEFEKRYVKTGISDGVKIEVISGVEEEEYIKIPN